MAEVNLTIDGLTAENDSLRFKVARLEQHLKYHKEFLNEVKINGVKSIKKRNALLDLLSDLDKHEE